MAESHVIGKGGTSNMEAEVRDVEGQGRMLPSTADGWYASVWRSHRLFLANNFLATRSPWL